MLLLTQIKGRPNRPRLSQGDPTPPREDALARPSMRAKLREAEGREAGGCGSTTYA